MLELFQEFARDCTYMKMFIAEHDSISGARIGGNPPIDVVPNFVNSHTRYFATLPLDLHGEHELSIFISFEECSRMPSVFEYRGKIIDEKCNIIQLVVHTPQNRKKSNDLVSEISSHALVIPDNFYSEVTDDYQEYEGHKIGGIPIFSYKVDNLLDDLALLTKENYVHIAQISFPDEHDALINVNWPFAQHIFHIFGKEDLGGYKFVSCWG